MIGVRLEIGVGGLRVRCEISHFEDFDGKVVEKVKRYVRNLTYDGTTKRVYFIKRYLEPREYPPFNLVRSGKVR